jgi:hypothetical protein
MFNSEHTARRSFYDLLGSDESMMFWLKENLEILIPVGVLLSPFYMWALKHNLNLVGIETSNGGIILTCVSISIIVGTISILKRECK